MSDSKLKIRILDDIKQAMKDKNKDKLSTLRMLTAAIKQKEVDERVELTDEDVIVLIGKLVKQRREAAKQYVAGARQDLADKENAEVEIFQEYLPQQLSEQELATIIETAVTETGAVSIKDMGTVMGVVKNKVQGRADMGEVGKRIKDILAAKS